MSKKQKSIIIILALVCMALAALSIDRESPTVVENSVGSIIEPVQEANTDSMNWFNRVIKYFSNQNKLINENKELKDELLKSNATLNRLNLVEQENEELSNLLGMQKRYTQYETVGAQIIAKDPGNWYSTFTINKGSADGLEKNMVVINEDGLIGKISECGYNYSKVISIIDDSDAVSAQSVRTADIGYITANYQQEGYCRMQYSDDTMDILVGDELVTSHLSQIFPQGITIGYVRQLSSDENSLAKYATIEPAVDFSNLKYVLVINHNFSKENKE
ncbi:MAG: rod shape-determining protein MreC [Lachnospirales bacterium]